MHLSYFASIFFFPSQLCWPCISCISCTGMKTPPHLYTMPSAASVISLPFWELPLLTHGWENSSKEDGRSHPQKFYRLISQRLPLRAYFPKQEHTISSMTDRISLRQTHRKAISFHYQFFQYFYILFNQELLLFFLNLILTFYPVV